MKKCKLYSTAKGIAVEAFIVDNKVLVPIQIDAETRYVPPAKAVAFARDESVWYLPFSVQCKWGKFGECTKDYLYNNYDESDPRPCWAIDREIDDIPENGATVMLTLAKSKCRRSGSIAKILLMFTPV